MNLYSRTLRHIDMNRVKKLHEEKVKQKKLIEKEKEQIIEDLRNLNSPEFSNWRCELKEGMTSSGVFQTTLPATGDLTISSNDFSDEGNILGNASISGDNVVMQHGVMGVDAPIVNANYTHFNQVITGNIDASKSSDITISINKPTSSFSSWQDRDPAENFNDNIQVVIFSARDPIGNHIELSADFSGTQRFTIPNNLRVSDLRVQFSQFGLMWLDPNSPDSGTLDSTISVITTQRTTPITVFVPLDSPEAAAFIRTDPIMANLSPEERKKKLQDMLDASDEYIEKIFGEGFPGTGLDPAVGEAGDTPGVEIAGVGPYGPGHMPAPIPPANSSPRGPYTPIKDYGTPGNPKFMPSGPSKNPWGVGNKNPKPQKSMVASYEPKGQLISEKRKLKSPQEILKKIPGYYDGKPAPLGFPVEPPPKTINGYHPDLVDGKKVSDRFNRLDPESAKAMPFTGNPHIDKKVRAARKKPK